jgi:hypothetical protein
MEEGKEGGGFFSRFFRKRHSQQQEPARPTQSTEPPITIKEQQPSSAFEDRQKRMAELKKKREQAFQEHVSGQLTGQVPAPEMKDTRPEALKEQIGKKATEQVVDRARETQERFATKGTPGERFSRLSSQQPKATTNTPPAQEVDVKKNLTEKDVPTLSEKRAKQIDSEALKKSLQTPTSEWRKKEDAAKKELIEQTKKMEGITPTPKEEIKPETVQKIINKLEQKPSSQTQTPHFEAKGGSEVLKRALKAQEELKKAA